ncbi:hypothetical protein O181_110208 [Austropuccinia psidii MF-1]|uniref:OTU domain-containing protein n=1 Tax=Austropuccinia psidii MF-1 TaxID=1389203 RepID=A0A9Q3JXB7_9BASI|nr:hypothetical protein [Austropuccinia psidii MF-1]
MEVDSSEKSEDSEASLSKSISSSDSLPSATELKRSEVTLRGSRRLAIGSKTSQRKSHKPSTSLKIYDAIPGSEDLPKFILKYTFKAINVQGDVNCGYRTLSHYIYKTQDQWGGVRDDLAEEVQQNQDLYEAMNTLIPSLSSYLKRIEW